MAESNNKQPLTLSDLGVFTEDVLLPAIENIIDQKLDEKLDPIKQELFSIKQDIKWIMERMETMEKTGSEDVIAVNNDVESLKQRVAELESQVRVLQASGA